jgi:hypothetical protein
VQSGGGDTDSYGVIARERQVNGYNLKKDEKGRKMNHSIEVISDSSRLRHGPEPPIFKPG